MTYERSVNDYFCGCGGSSTGLILIPGVEVRVAANHWFVSLETHAANHPHTRHVFGDLRETDPSSIAPTTLGLFSPECTSHSGARGKTNKNVGWRTLWGDDHVDPTEERSRATMREVIDFSAAHKYKLVILENVTEVRGWIHYPAWLQAMHNLGYEHKEVFLNSMIAGAPQSRDRIYVCFWLKGNKAPDLDIRPRCWCPHCEHDVNGIWAKKNMNAPLPNRVQYGKQYQYVCPACYKPVLPYVRMAADVIDWSLPAPTIGSRKKELSPNTLRRIQKGLDKYQGNTYMMDTAHSYEESDNSHLRPVTDVLPTVTTAQSMSVVLPEPFIVSFYGRDSAHKPIHEPLPTLTTVQHQQALCVPPAAFIAPYYGVDNAYGVDRPLGTIETRSRHGLVVIPPGRNYIAEAHGTSSLRPVEEPLSTVLAGGRHLWLVTTDSDRPKGEIDACGYRMLKVRELADGMDFPHDYIICGTSDEVMTKQVGNAVTPPAATIVGTRMFDSLL